MPSYIVRIELPGASDYGALNSAMQQEDFVQTIISKEGLEYHLHLGTYRLPDGIAPSLGHAMQRAKTAAARALQAESVEIRKLNAEPAILVIDGDEGTRWSGLTPVL
jgi:hypothetical protein